MQNFLSNVKSKNPLIHCITNYVTVNDVANSIIAVGASPVMADEPKEVADITKIANALVINLGTLNERTIKAMEISLSVANELKIPSILDPVGFGASEFRAKTALNLLKNFKFSVVRGNVSEIKLIRSLLSFDSGFKPKIFSENLENLTVYSEPKGVDASLDDLEFSIEKRVKISRDLSRILDSVIIISGKIDTISDQNRSFLCKNGTSMMSEISGSGCVLTGIIGAYLGANDDLMMASIAATIHAGLAGELAKEKGVLTQMGSMTFRKNFIDQIYLMSDESLVRNAKFEEFQGEI